VLDYLLRRATVSGRWDVLHVVDLVRVYEATLHVPYKARDRAVNIVGEPSNTHPRQILSSQPTIDVEQGGGLIARVMSNEALFRA
jgi:hypothetical protein